MPATGGDVQHRIARLGRGVVQDPFEIAAARMTDTADVGVADLAILRSRPILGVGHDVLPWNRRRIMCTSL